MKTFLLRFVASILLVTAPCFAERTSNNDASTHDDADLLWTAADLVAAAGVTELCHPYRDDLPGFPRCSISGILQQQQQQQQPNRNRLLEEYYQDDDKVSTEEYFEEEVIYRSRWYYIYNRVMAVLCVIFGALVSGVMIGLLSLDPLLLLIKARASENPVERQQAAAILPVVKQHHLLLVSLLLLNTMASEALQK